MVLIPVSNVVVAVSYFFITAQLINFVRDSKLGDLFFDSSKQPIQSKKRKGPYPMLLGITTLFASFIALCGVTHALGAIRSFYPALTAIETVQTALLVVCAIVSLATAIVCLKIFPILLKIITRFELNNEGNLEHAENYMLEIVEMVKESIMVISSELNIVRMNEASKELFGSHCLAGKSMLEFVHPDDLAGFQTCAVAALVNYGATPMTIEYRIKPAALVHIPSRRVPAPSSVHIKTSRVHVDPLLAAFSHDAGPFAQTSSMASLLGSPHSRPAATGYIWVESTILKHIYKDEDDVFQGTLEMVTRNIDERRRKHQRQFDSILKETEEQSRINAAKMRYLSCIAHDLKTPLQSFCYTLDLLLQTKLHSDQRELIQQANVAVDLMKLTISQTMDVSKALTGAKLMPRRTTVSLSSITKKVQLLISGFGKQVPVHFMQMPDIADEIITDEEWLWQMMLNLLTNACKYTDKGSITVRVSLSRAPKSTTPRSYEPSRFSNFSTSHSQLTIEPTVTSDMLLFEVIDTGVGVSDRKLSIMFDAFAQVQEGQVTGTGLGLYGVRMRAEGLQGTCGARHNTESCTGTGTVIWFDIPYLPDNSDFLGGELTLRACEEATQPPQESPYNSISVDLSGIYGQQLSAVTDIARRAQEILSSRPLTAMVVEDTLTVRKLMERMLLQMGFAKVVGYENGSKGLDAMMAEPVDIVFSDVQMPIMTGPEMVTRFRKFEESAILAGIRSKRQIVVAVTANATELKDQVNSGFDDVYPKPLERNDIYKIVNRFL